MIQQQEPPKAKSNNSPQVSKLKRELSAWRVMRRRCLDPNFKDWPRYGGSGITICKEWETSFATFLKDLGPAPSPKHWLGRQNVKKGYEPTNCLWTTREEQMRRRAFCRKILMQGQFLTAAEASRLPLQPTRNSVLRRFESGLPVETSPSAKLYKASMWLAMDSKVLPLPEVARAFGIERRLLWSRIRKGVPLHLALSPSRLPPQWQRATP